MITHLDRIKGDGATTLYGIPFRGPGAGYGMPTRMKLLNGEYTIPSVMCTDQYISSREPAFCKTCLGIFLLEKVK